MRDFLNNLNARLLMAIVLLRLAVGGIFLVMAYSHWQDDTLVQTLSSQWIDWTDNTPLFWVQDLTHWVLVPNAWLFARLQLLVEGIAGFSVATGLYHQWGIQLMLGWVTLHILWVAHLQLPYLNAALLGLLVLLAVLWLADAGRWGGLDRIRFEKQCGHNALT